MSVQSVLDRLNLRYRLINDEAFAKCPFHSPDWHPSWSVNIKSGVYYCFSCGAKGNLANLITTVTGVSYADAVIQANEAVGHARMDKWKEQQEAVSLSPMSFKISEDDMAFFVNPPTDMLEAKHVDALAASHYDIRWNKEHQSWIFPYRDPYSGELWGWQEKNQRIFRNYPAGTKKSRTLFGYQKLHTGGQAFLLESPIDAAVMRSAGVLGAVASFGILSGAYQLALLQNKRINTLILTLDNDKAGKQATKDIIPEAMKLFRWVRVFNYDFLDTKAKDPGEMTAEQIQIGAEYAVPAMEWMRENKWK